MWCKPGHSKSKPNPAKATRRAHRHSRKGIPHPHRGHGRGLHKRRTTHRGSMRRC